MLTCLFLLQSPRIPSLLNGPELINELREYRYASVTSYREQTLLCVLSRLAMAKSFLSIRCSPFLKLFGQGKFGATASQQDIVCVN